MNIEQSLAAGATAALPSVATQAPFKGAFALPGVTGKVTAELVVCKTGPLTPAGRPLQKLPSAPTGHMANAKATVPAELMLHATPARGSLCAVDPGQRWRPGANGAVRRHCCASAVASHDSR